MGPDRTKRQAMPANGKDAKAPDSCVQMASHESALGTAYGSASERKRPELANTGAPVWRQGKKESQNIHHERNTTHWKTIKHESRR
jgi:hypothetical protein